MKKSILGISFMSTILAVVICLSVSVAAADTMTVSSQLVAKIKGYEGFVQYPVADHSQYSVGYGSACNPSDYPNGITEAEAEVLLLNHIATFEVAVNSFTKNNNITLAQQEFDALVSMTYNLGTNWIKAENKVWSYLITGNYTDAEMASAMAAWCNAGGSMLEGLVTRRLDEAQIFLYGDYYGTGTQQLAKTYFDANGGTKSNKVMFHPKGETYGILATAENEGYYFAGWYTSGGTLVTESTVVTGNQTLYAHWTTAPVEQVVETPAVEIVATGPFSDVADDAWYTTYISQLEEQKVLGGYTDGTFRPENDVTTGEVLKIVMTASGYDTQEPLDDHWASGYFQTAAEDGLLKGMTINDVDTPLSRENVAILVVNILEAETVEQETVFVDTDSQAANVLYNLGIINGNVDAQNKRWFYPETCITRAELAKIVVAMLDL